MRATYATTDEEFQTLLDNARAAKVALDEEQARTGRWLVDEKTGLSNWDRWHLAATELARAVLHREWASKSGASP